MGARVEGEGRAGMKLQGTGMIGRGVEPGMIDWNVRTV